GGAPARVGPWPGRAARRSGPRAWGWRIEGNQPRRTARDRWPLSPVVSRPEASEPPMSHDPSVARRQVEITNDFGLHLGPAAKFVKLANRFQSDIRVSNNGKEINGKSILDLTLLAAECGTRLELEARGPDAEAAVEALARLVLSQFRESGEEPEREPAP